MEVSDVSHGLQNDTYRRNTVISIQNVKERDFQKEDSSSLSIHNMFKPLITFFKISGIYCERKQGSLNRKDLLHRIYCMIILFLIAADTVRFLNLLGQIQEISSTMMGICAYMCYYVAGVALTVSFFISSSMYLPNFLDLFERFRIDYGVHFNLSKTRKVMIIEIILMVFISILGSVTVSVMIMRIYIHNSGWSVVKANFTPFQDEPFDKLLIFTTMFAIIRIILAMIQSGICMFFMHVSYCIYCEFKFVSNRIQKIVNSGSQEDVFCEFEHLRQQHESIKTILLEANKIIQHVVFVILSTDIPIICFLLYGLIHQSLPKEDIDTMMNIIIITCVVLTTTVTVGATVCSQVGN